MEKSNVADEQMRNIAKVEVREYFDQFLKDVYPKLVKEHFNSCEHGRLLNRVRWIGIGIIIALAPSSGLSVISIIQKIVSG